MEKLIRLGILVYMYIYNDWLNPKADSAVCQVALQAMTSSAESDSSCDSIVISPHVLISLVDSDNLNIPTSTRELKITKGPLEMVEHAVFDGLLLEALSLAENNLVAVPDLQVSLCLLILCHID